MWAVVNPARVTGAEIIPLILYVLRGQDFVKSGLYAERKETSSLQGPSDSPPREAFRKRRGGRAVVVSRRFHRRVYTHTSRVVSSLNSRSKRKAQRASELLARMRSP